MRADDPFRAAEALERLESQHARVRAAFLLPEAGEDELEVRRLDRPPSVAAGRETGFEPIRTGARERESPDLDLVEHALDEGGLRR